MALIDLVRELCSLNDDNLAERVIKDSDVQWCLSELLDILEQEEKQNEPLTLDELGEMSYTDWVWLVFPGEKPSESCWERGWKAYRLYSHERYGVSWIAYRHPPEGENNVIEVTEDL